MGINDHNRRSRVFSAIQHPFRHSISDFAYANEALPGVSNLQGAFDYLVAVLYPQSQPAVATPAALPLVGNTINDMRVVTDDGDSKAASYRWEIRESDLAAKWYKIYDLDWGTDSILQGFLLKTQDIYVHRLGYDDIDDTGAYLAGVDAGQHVYGGRTPGSHLSLHANSGDGVGAQTGFVQVTDNFRPQVDSMWSSGTTTERWLKVWTDDITSGTLTMTSGSITDTSGTISLSDEHLVTTGNISGAVITGSTSGVFGLAGDMTITAGSILSASGTITFGNENLNTTGTLASGVATISADLVLGAGSITSVSGNISFDNENLLTTGTLGAGVTTVTQLNVDDLRLDGNTLSVQTLNTNLNFIANGTGVIDMQSAMTTLGQTVTGTLGVTGILNVDNLRLDGNTLSSTNVDGNIIIDPNGVGLVELGAGTFPTTTASFDLGKTGNLWQNLWMSGSINDGVTSITSATLQSLRNINVGVADGMSLFYDNATSTWLASAPDTEIDHGTVSGLGGDDHTQYLLLLGRAGGQSIIGGTAASENLVLESTSDVTKGKILVKDTLQPFTNASYAAGWSGTDVGGSANKFRHVYTAGEFFGLRLENLGVDPASSVQNVGRLIWNTAEASVKVDTGTAIVKVASYRYEEDTVWDGATLLKNVAVTGIDATKALWQLKNNSNDYETMYVSLKATTTTNVRITTNVFLPAGSYRLVGVQ